MILRPEDIRIAHWERKPRSPLSPKITNGVHIIHLPTGLEVFEDSDRSQHRNKEIALKRLAKLFESMSTSKKVNRRTTMSKMKLSSTTLTHVHEDGSETEYHLRVVEDGPTDERTVLLSADTGSVAILGPTWHALRDQIELLMEGGDL